MTPGRRTGWILAGEKIPNGVSDFFSVRFQRGVSGIEELDLRIGNTALEGLGTGRQKERIVLAPHRKETRALHDGCLTEVVESMWKLSKK